MAVRELLDRLGGSRASLADKCRELAAVLAEVTDRLVAAVKEQLAASPLLGKVAERGRHLALAAAAACAPLLAQMARGGVPAFSVTFLLGFFLGGR